MKNMTNLVRWTHGAEQGLDDGWSTDHRDRAKDQRQRPWQVKYKMHGDGEQCPRDQHTKRNQSGDYRAVAADIFEFERQTAFKQNDGNCEGHKRKERIA